MPTLSTANPWSLHLVFKVSTHLVLHLVSERNTSSGFACLPKSELLEELPVLYSSKNCNSWGRVGLRRNHHRNRNQVWRVARKRSFQRSRILLGILRDRLLFPVFCLGWFDQGARRTAVPRSHLVITLTESESILWPKSVGEVFSFRVKESSERLPKFWEVGTRKLGSRCDKCYQCWLGMWGRQEIKKSVPQSH